MTGGETFSSERSRWWIRSKRSPPGTLRLLCFPYAGGSGYVFRSWHSKLPNWVEVYSAQLPGRLSRLDEAHFHRVPELVAALGPAVLPLVDRPFALFGHSLGALLAFEVARFLRSVGKTPLRLFVAGRQAPHLPPTEPPFYGARDEDFIAKLAELRGTSGEVLGDPALLQLFLPTLRADFELAQTYQYTNEPPLACPIIAVGGAEESDLTDDSLSSWHIHTSNSFSAHRLPGDHFFIHSSEDPLLRLLREELSAYEPAEEARQSI